MDSTWEIPDLGLQTIVPGLHSQ